MDATQREKRINLAVGAMVVVTAVVFWFQRDYTTPYGGTFADPVIIALGGLGLVLFVAAALGRPVGTQSAQDEPVPVKGLITAIVVLTAWAIALPYLGYLVSGAIFFALTASLMRVEKVDWRGVALDVAVAIVTSTAFFLVFTRVLYVRLPPFPF